jgi:hypothetical protein
LWQLPQWQQGLKESVSCYHSYGIGYMLLVTIREKGGMLSRSHFLSHVCEKSVWREIPGITAHMLAMRPDVACGFLRSRHRASFFGDASPLVDKSACNMFVAVA